jgi:hypothetical protein
VKMRGSLKLYRVLTDGKLHVANPCQDFALCGINTHGAAQGHPNDAVDTNICETCRDRQDNKPGAWDYARNFGVSVEGHAGDNLPIICNVCHVRQGDQCQCEVRP